jgi:hypothetical protein
MTRRNKHKRPPRAKLPALLDLGPTVVEKSEALRKFTLLARAYREGATIMSLRKAHQLCLQNAKVWGVEEYLVDSWESWRAAAFEAESLFSKYFGVNVQLFIKPGEGMPWVGLTEWAEEASQLCDQFLAWYDNPGLHPGATRRG